MGRAKLPQSLENLIKALNQLPGIGPKMAQRLALHIMKTSGEDVKRLAQALIEAKEKVKPCSVCGNLTDKDPCAICIDPGRDRETICVIEQPSDIFVIERTGGFRGLYHVLMGALSPLDGIGPEDLRIKELLTRVKSSQVREVILATDPDTEGEATAIYLSQLLKPSGIKITRIASGIPSGGDIEYADDITLTKALEGRRDF